MGLVKKVSQTQDDSDEKRGKGRSLADLLCQLQDDDPTVRRWAVRDLAGNRDALDALAALLAREQTVVVREALFTSLLACGGPCVQHVVPLLRSEDPLLRNYAIGVLQQLPQDVAEQVQMLLADKDSDVRIFALDILKTLAHPDAPRWLSQVIEFEPHPNVLSTALDRAIELGDASMIPLIDKARARFAQEPQIQFVADLAIQRLGEGMHV